MKSVNANKPKNSVPKTSKVQKLSLVKKQPTQARKKPKHTECLKSIKEKLAGKNYSPTIEKARNKKTNKISVSSNSSILGKKSLPNEPKIIQTPAKKKESNAGIKSVESKNNISPGEKDKKKEGEKLYLKPDVKKEKRSSARGISLKNHNTSQKGAKSAQLNEDKEQQTTKGKKRKSGPEISGLPTQHKKKILVESESTHISAEVKTDKHSTPVKPRVFKSKREYSTSSKGLNPISNIRSLAKKPQKFSKVQFTKKLASFPERGVCYFSHIPHGFYEKQLKNYCSQFGKVTGVYHPVSKQGNSRGYAFVEFQHKEVAEVVAETMNNYLMFNRLLKCQYIPPESQKPWVFKQDRNNERAATLRRRENQKLQNKLLSKEKVKKWKKRRLARVNAIKKRLAKLGVDYEFQVNDTEIGEFKSQDNDKSDVKEVIKVQ